MFKNQTHLTLFKNSLKIYKQKKMLLPSWEIIKKIMNQIYYKKLILMKLDQFLQLTKIIKIKTW